MFDNIGPHYGSLSLPRDHPIDQASCDRYQVSKISLQSALEKYSCSYCRRNTTRSSCDSAARQLIHYCNELTLL